MVDYSGYGAGTLGGSVATALPRSFLPTTFDGSLQADQHAGMFAQGSYDDVTAYYQNMSQYLNNAGAQMSGWPYQTEATGYEQAWSDLHQPVPPWSQLPPSHAGMDHLAGSYIPQLQSYPQNIYSQPTNSMYREGQEYGQPTDYESFYRFNSNQQNYNYAQQHQQLMASSPPEVPSPGTAAPMFQNARFKRIRHCKGDEQIPSAVSNWASPRKRVSTGCGEDAMLNSVGCALKSVIGMMEQGVRSVVATFLEFNLPDDNYQPQQLSPEQSSSQQFSSQQQNRQPHVHPQQPNYSKSNGSLDPRAYSQLQPKEEQDRVIAEEVRRAIQQWH